MAQQLEAAGERAALVAMFDTYGPDYYEAPHGLGALRGAPLEAYLRIEHHVGSLAHLPKHERFAYVKDKLNKVVEEGAESFDEWRREIGRGVLTRMGRAIPEDLEQVRNAVNEALMRYRPKPYSGKVTLFRARRQAPGTNNDPTLGWGAIARGGVEIIPMPGYHAAMISEPRVSVLVPELRALFERAERDEATATSRR
jgi:thioesterase domain-containing protein